MMKLRVQASITNQRNRIEKKKTYELSDLADIFVLSATASAKLDGGMKYREFMHTVGYLPSS